MISFSPRGLEGRRATTRLPRPSGMVNSLTATGATALAPAKINLGLRVTGVRADGYHLLDSIIVPIALFDRLTIRVRPAARVGVELRCSQPGIPCGDENLIVRAARLFLERTKRAADIAVDLDKHIPVGGGLGGGSSDAAAALLALDRLLCTGIEAPQLMEWGAELGADVPFFVHGRPARVRGIGEVVDELDFRCPWFLVVVFPGFSLSTAAVYRAYDASLTNRFSDSSVPTFASARTPLHESLVPESLVNDLEAVATQIHPPIRTLKLQLLDMGALGAHMTGSGSAVFGVWERREEAYAAAEQMQRKGNWARAVEILDATPEIECAMAGA